MIKEKKSTTVPMMKTKIKNRTLYSKKVKQKKNLKIINKNQCMLFLNICKNSESHLLT